MTKKQHPPSPPSLIPQWEHEQTDITEDGAMLEHKEDQDVTKQLDDDLTPPPPTTHTP
ncbi:MAG TPA: hypothetical protein VLG38_02010 [Gammaproteobacteria bacterium]|nr:hypothetical protein [Gammaproteobacteria bacterium]